MARSAILNVMVQAAIKAGRSLARDYIDAKSLNITLKGPANYVSQADIKSENIIKSTLMTAKPDYSYIMEESGQIIGKDHQHKFIIDPLDGTTNFLHNIPYFCVSIALESQNNLVAAVIYNPILDELFTAERGKGAFLNDRRIRVSAQKNLENCLMCTGIPFIGRAGHGKFLKELSLIMPQIAGIRRNGAAALDLAYLAAGRFDGFWEYNLQLWDIAAGILLIKEAGGFISNCENKPAFAANETIVAGNEYTHKTLLKLISEANTK